MVLMTTERVGRGGYLYAALLRALVPGLVGAPCCPRVAATSAPVMSRFFFALIIDFLKLYHVRDETWMDT